ncbi:lipase 3-like [Leguminivora glycinivorella]|uniref:lipase 3-like n=1 Tax=Leguminivora glycinivorella TaxID=1035111 RepID=UPI00200C1A9E|nr:lipase 3-like [Leguminivora glycinivorella]
MILSMSIVLVLMLMKVSSEESDSEVSGYKTDPGILEDAILDTWSLIRKYGYPCEIHRVYTEDGYILELHRIPHGRENANLPGPRPVVFLQHGLLSSSAEWVLMMPGKGFAYILAEAGYDVWMGNARGNTYSKRHVSIKPTSSSFWKFSWHEIGYYDLPAMIDYVIKNTGVPKLQYVGFSQGTTAFWVMASTRPEYNEKISAMQALAPVAYVGNIRSPLIKAIAPLTNSLELIMKIIGANEFLPNGKINELAGQTLCVEESIAQALCTNLLFLICGYNDAQLNATMLPIVLGHTPAGAATRQLIHYGQLYKSSKFVQFDHGLLTNKRKYGTFKPPPYDLSNIRTPVFLHYADNDWLSTPNDVDKLLREVKSAVGKYKVPLPKFNHLDFVFAMDAKKLIYDRVMKIMEQFV